MAPGPLADIEKQNARQWDTDSAASEEEFHPVNPLVDLEGNTATRARADSVVSRQSQGTGFAVAGPRTQVLPQSQRPQAGGFLDQQPLSRTNAHPQSTRGRSSFASLPPAPVRQGIRGGHANANVNTGRLGFHNQNQNRSNPGSAQNERARRQHPPHKPSTDRSSAISNDNRNTRSRNRASSEARGHLRPPRQSNRNPLSHADKWADPTLLVTTRRAIDQDQRAREDAENKQYLGVPNKDVEYTATAHYFWPYSKQSATELLGWRLEELDVIRLGFKVWIEWQPSEDGDYLKISSRASVNVDDIMMDAIDGIRYAVISANARSVSAAPLKIVAPPLKMRSIVRPKTAERGPLRARCLQLAGPWLPLEAQQEWQSGRQELVDANKTAFQEHITKSLMSLAPVKTWMRMRVDFGHVVLTQYKVNFGEGKYNFKDFATMLENPRTTVSFDKRLPDPRVAMILKREILKMDSRFVPVAGPVSSLEDVRFNETETVFLTAGGGYDMRIEADLDVTYEDNCEQYQLGCVKLYGENSRDTRVNITTIDIERELDYCLEVVSDNSVKMEKQFYAIVASSISDSTPISTDPLGLKYPKVKPRPSYGVKITGIDVKSVIQFMLKDSQYVIEITIRRQWYGCSTFGSPDISASVSMFHPDWDTEMESIENTTKTRHWVRSLANFFGKERDGRGMERFRTEVHMIQSLLFDAMSEAETREESSSLV